MWIRMIVHPKSDSSWISEGEHKRSDPQLEDFPKGSRVGRHRLLLKTINFWQKRQISGKANETSGVLAFVKFYVKWVQVWGFELRALGKLITKRSIVLPTSQCGLPQSTSHKNLKLNQPTRLRGVSQKGPRACDTPFKLPGSIDACLIRPFWKGPAPIQRLPISLKPFTLSFKLTA